MRQNQEVISTQPKTDQRFLLKNIYKSFVNNNARVTVLEGANFSIPEKQVTALVGHSGSGKSSLARILIQIDAPDTGMIYYQDQPIQTTPLKEFNRKNQLMLQNAPLSVHPRFRIKKILAEPLIINFPLLNKKDVEHILSEWMDILELPLRYLEKYPHQISGGEIQRVVLGRTLIMKPDFIILDEPFSSLDEIMAFRLMRYLKQLFNHLKIGVLLISHHAEQVDYLTNQIYCLEKGKIRLSTRQEYFGNEIKKNENFPGGPG